VSRPRVILPPAEAHRLWADSYDTAPNPLVALERRAAGGALTVAGRRVLDVGCGTGDWLRGALDAGASGAGIDSSAEMLARARARGLALARADARMLPVRNRVFDLARAAFCAGYLEDPELLIAELARIVRPGGRVWLADFHPDAVARGWKRAFRTGETTCEIVAFSHTAADLEAAGRRRGLVLDARIDAPFDEPERPLFRAAGKESVFEEIRGAAALLAFVWKRP
jgi:SAM-dependent methyltransferase